MYINCIKAVTNLQEVFTNIKMELLMSEMKQDPVHLLMDYISNKNPFQTVSNPENASGDSELISEECDNSSVDSPNTVPNTYVSNFSGEYKIK